MSTEKIPTSVMPLNSPEAVALALAQIIAQQEYHKPKDPKLLKQYWFNLYRECLAVVRDQPPETSTE